MVAGLLMYAVLNVLSGGRLASSTSVGVSMLPLVMTLGISEWQLHLFRSDSALIQFRTHDFRAFAHQVRLSLFLRVSAYALVLGLCTTAVTMPLLAHGTADATLVWRMVGYAMLGVALFVASILLSCGLLARTVAAIAVALVAVVATLVWAPASVEVLTAVQACIFTLLFLTLWATAIRTLGSPMRFL
jgi:hypothetical protein